MKCANCERTAHDPVFCVAILQGEVCLVTNICGHCWNAIFMAPGMTHRLWSLATKQAQPRLPTM